MAYRDGQRFVPSEAMRVSSALEFYGEFAIPDEGQREVFDAQRPRVNADGELIVHLPLVRTTIDALWLASGAYTQMGDTLQPGPSDRIRAILSTQAKLAVQSASESASDTSDDGDKYGEIAKRLTALSARLRAQSE